MKTRRFFCLMVVLAMLLTLLPVMAVTAAPAEKVDVCHFDKDTGVYFKINISENAFQSHVDHGDAAPGDWVPGMMDKQKFAEDCSIYWTIPQKELVDTIQVTSTKKAVTYTHIPLLSNQLYELKAIGTYKYADWTNSGIADAKYSHRIASVVPYIAGWVDGAELNVDPLRAYGLQVTIFDGDLEKPLTPVGWVEENNADHIYTAPYTGTGAQLGLFIWDDQYADNVGFITVEIYQVNW